MPTATLSYDDTPPSMNVIVGRGDRRVFHVHKKLWQGIFEALLMESTLPRNMTRVEAVGVLRFGVRRKRDEGNFRVVLEKSLGDALVAGRWLPDDTADHYSFGRVALLPDNGKPRTTIKLDCCV